MPRSPPGVATPARAVAPHGVGPRTNPSVMPLVSPATRVVAGDWNATDRPSAEILAAPPPLLPWAPLEDTLIRLIVPAVRSRTNASIAPLVSPVTRLVAVELKATNRPSAETDAPA